MKTKIVIELESKDKLEVYDEGAKSNKKINIAKDFHDEVVLILKNIIKDFAKDEFMDSLSENYIEEFDNAEDYGLKVTLTDTNTKQKDKVEK